MTTIDFARALQDAKGASFDALPVGDYDVQVTKAEATSSSNGKPMLKVTMKVISGPYEKRTVFNNFVLSLDNPQATAIFFRHMRAFGLDEQFFAALGSASSLDPVANALVERRARLTLGQREWNGQQRNEVKAVKPLAGGVPVAPPVGPYATGGVIAGPVPPAAASVAPPAAPVAQQPVAPAPPQPAPQPTPAPAPAPAPQPTPQAEVPTAAPVAAPVQPMPQPPAPEQPVAQAVPTENGAGTADTVPSQPASTPGTSEAAPAGMPQLPF